MVDRPGTARTVMFAGIVRPETPREAWGVGWQAGEEGAAGCGGLDQAGSVPGQPSRGAGQPGGQTIVAVLGATWQLKGSSKGSRKKRVKVGLRGGLFT